MGALEICSAASKSKREGPFCQGTKRSLQVCKIEKVTPKRSALLLEKKVERFRTEGESCKRGEQRTRGRIFSEEFGRVQGGEEEYA